MEANDVPDQPGESLIIIIKLELETEDNLNSDEESQTSLHLLNADEEPFQTENENIGEIGTGSDQLQKTLNHEHSQKGARVERENELRNCEKGFMLKLDGSEQSLVTDANVLVKRSARVVYVDENNQARTIVDYIPNSTAQIKTEVIQDDEEEGEVLWDQRAAIKNECEKCPKAFVNKTFLLLHIDDKHPEVRNPRPLPCKFCDDIFTIEPRLVTHMQKVHGKSYRRGLVEREKINRDGNFGVCGWCGKGFKQEKALKNHERLHTGKNLYNCKICGKSFQLKARLATHVRYRHELPIILDGQDEMGKEGDTEKCVKDASSLGLEEKYDIQGSQRRDTPENVTTDYLKTEQNVCNVCPQRFPQADNLKTHCTQNISLVKDERANQGRHKREGWVITNKLVQNKNVQQSSSNTCDQKIPRISLGKLETIKEDNSNHICDHIDCNKSFKSAKRLKYHLKKYHQAQLFVCNYEGCSDKFEKYANLRIHFKTHIGEPPYVCDYEDCKRSFKSYPALKVHTKCHTGDDLYSCCHADCGKSFTTKGKLKVHAKTHTGDDLYTCCQAGCGKSFTTKWKLKIHTKKHTGDDLYTCFHAGCGKSFTTNSKLKIHLRKHTGEKPHVCDECNKGFSRSDHLKRHLRTHTGEKPHACTVCQKQFATFTLCKRHGMSHTGEKPYSCKVCQKKFSREDTLKKHVIICQG